MGRGRIQFTHTYEDIISIENLLAAWQEFISGKRKRKDVQEFSRKLLYNIGVLHTELANETYRHGDYHAFKVYDPKPRDIHKATVRDRLVHHAVHRQLYPLFERTFCSDCTSSRKAKGTLVAINRFRTFARRIGACNRKTVWVLKCDIRKFFASIDHGILLEIVSQYVPDERVVGLIHNIVDSFHIGEAKVGLPIGNLTSQLLVNVYMNEFDQFVKHRLKAKQYIRYADDFVILSDDYNWLTTILPKIRDFLRYQLQLELHPHKVSIETLASGVDFLGWVHFPDHRVLRTTTKRRMMRRLQGVEYNEQVSESYLGLLSHGNTHKLQGRVRDLRKAEKTVH